LRPDRIVMAIDRRAPSRPSPDATDLVGAFLGFAVPTVTGEIRRHRQELRAALDELPARERTMILLRFFGDRTQTQIAEEMGLSQMHVSRLLGRSLTVLRHRMTAT
jgi:RNA polymerase sigma-B factor